MRYLYLDKDRFALKQPSVAIRDEEGNVEYVDEVRGFGFYRMRSPHGEPLTPTGPAAWVETRNLLTVGNVRCLMVLGSLSFWGLVIWVVMRWVSQP